MEIQGKITKLLGEQTGTGKNGQWRKREYIIETEDKFPKKICFNLWGERIDQFHLKEGDRVKIFFDLESREFNGRWYTDVKAWKVESAVKGSKNDYPVEESPSMGESSESIDNPPPLTEDDLPF
jgi:hypothetical protein